MKQQFLGLCSLSTICFRPSSLRILLDMEHVAEIYGGTGLKKEAAMQFLHATSNVLGTKTATTFGSIVSLAFVGHIHLAQ